MRKYALLVVSLFKYLVAFFKPLLNSLQTFFIPRHAIIHQCLRLKMVQSVGHVEEILKDRDHDTFAHIHYEFSLLVAVFEVFKREVDVLQPIVVVCEDLINCVQVEIRLQCSPSDREELCYEDETPSDKVEISVFLMVLHVDCVHVNELVPLNQVVCGLSFVVISNDGNDLSTRIFWWLWVHPRLDLTYYNRSNGSNWWSND